VGSASVAAGASRQITNGLDFAAPGWKKVASRHPNCRFAHPGLLFQTSDFARQSLNRIPAYGKLAEPGLGASGNPGQQPPAPQSCESCASLFLLFLESCVILFIPFIPVNSPPAF
jgi:hypothetical protein